VWLHAFLPSGRAGLMDAKEFLLERISRGYELGEHPLIPGRIIEWLRTQEQICNEPRWDVKGPAEECCERMFGGRIFWDEIQKRWFFVTKNERLPVEKASSGVREFQPVVACLQWLARASAGREPIVIIEEPEAHLHPKAIREEARFFARLAKIGFRLVLTTHSDYLVEQLGNLIKLGSVGAKDEEEKAVALRPKDVAVYLFRRCSRAKGFETVPVEVNEDGIDTTEFGEVMGAIYNEYADYHHRKPPKRKQQNG